MRTLWPVWVLGLTLSFGWDEALAQGTRRTVTTVAEAVLGKGGRATTRTAVEELALRIERCAVGSVDDVLLAVERTGERGLVILEGAAPEVRPVLARTLGREGPAVLTALEDNTLRSLVLRHGDDAAAALARHPSLAGPVVADAGVPAAKALAALERTPAYHLAKLHAEGSALARDPRVLQVIEHYGDRGMAFVWKHKGALAVTATLTAFLQDPDCFINGVCTINTSEPSLGPPESPVPGRAAKGFRNRIWDLVITYCTVFHKQAS